MALWIKICGVTSVDDAVLALEAGADAIGVNLIPSSKRAVDFARASEIRAAVAGRARVVAVVADLAHAELENVRKQTGIEWLQLHGRESPAELLAVLPLALKAVPIGDAKDVEEAGRFAGDLLLTDTKTDGSFGGTGRRFDWQLVQDLARTRKLVLAGGLTPENVGAAVTSVMPFGVDVASGVEGPDPRRKDPERVRRFVAEARG